MVTAIAPLDRAAAQHRGGHQVSHPGIDHLAEQCPRRRSPADAGRSSSPR
ncbi:MAG TPA: hypothetical protein VMU94_29445 [Streptosporangiaceae bacterium]|nr:hypothetical protein [Streptosporangiaceae bacterium]